MIYIYAYTVGNFGDDLFVRTLVRRYRKTTKFYICSDPNYSTVFKNEENLVCNNKLTYSCLIATKQLFNYEGILRNHILLKFSKAVVRIGGSIFIEYPGWERQFHIDNKRTFIIGANYGPAITDNYLKASEQRILNACDCCFRDRYSYGKFAHISHVRYAPDVLFGYSYLPTVQPGEYVGISVIDLTNRKGLSQYQARYHNTLLEICEYYIKNKTKIKLLNFCIAEGDERESEKLLKELSSKEVVSVSYKDDIDMFMDEINSCHTIIATRFHAMILGWIMKKKVVPIIYNQKQSNVLMDIESNIYSWSIIDNRPFDICELEKIQYVNAEKIEKMISQSEEQFKALDEYLGL